MSFCLFEASLYAIRDVVSTHLPHSYNPDISRYARAVADLQHCDFYWAAEAVEWAYTSMLDDIEATRSKYPGEENEERDEMQTETEFRMDVQHEG
jgi:hypothetical protein